MAILALVLVLGLLQLLWVSRGGSQAEALRKGVREVLDTYVERINDPAKAAFPVRPAVRAGFERVFYSILSQALEKAGVPLESRPDFKEEVYAASAWLAAALSKDLVEQASSRQPAG